MSVYREAPRAGHPHAVRVEADLADMTERQLTSDGRCNWLIGYGDGVNEYCGAPAYSVCRLHYWFAEGWL